MTLTKRDEEPFPNGNLNSRNRWGRFWWGEQNNRMHQTMNLFRSWSDDVTVVHSGQLSLPYPDFRIISRKMGGIGDSVSNKKVILGDCSRHPLQYVTHETVSRMES